VRPDINVQLIEDKTIRLLPRLLSGAIDVAFVRPSPDRRDKRFEFHPLFQETAVVAVPRRHPLATRKFLTVKALAGEPLIVPDRRSRPHSHDLTIKLFTAAGLEPRIALVAEEKQTIVNLVAADIGLAIVPRSAARLAVSGVRYVRLRSRMPRTFDILPLAAAWPRDSRDAVRDDLLATLRRHLHRYAADA
jgi:DNA-binding transcriptional LysR family regulator